MNSLECYDEPKCPDPSDKQAMYIVQYVYYCCLTFAVWEWILCLPFEMKVIWRKSTPLWLQVIYTCPRYLGLVISIGNSAAISYIHIKYKVKIDSCQWLYTLQMISTATLLFCLETLLIFRLFVLFRCSHRVGFLLLALLILKTVAIIILAGLSIRYLNVGDACLMKHIPFTSVYVSAIELAFQSTIWCLTLYKHIRTHLEHGWQDIPLLSLITRDGTCTFGLLLIIYVALLKDAISAFIPIPDSTMRLCDMSFPILVTTLSLVTCRLIKNMRTFSPDSSSVDVDLDVDPLQSYETGTIQLTEVYSIDERLY